MVYDFNIREIWKYTFAYDELFIEWMNRHMESKEDYVQKKKDRLTKSFERNMSNFKMMTECVENEVKTELDTIIKSLTKSFNKRLENSIKEAEESYSIKEQLCSLGFFEFDEENKSVTYWLDMGLYGRYNEEDELPSIKTTIYADNKWHVNNPRKYKNELYYSELGNSSKKFTLLKIEEVISETGF